MRIIRAIAAVGAVALSLAFLVQGNVVVEDSRDVDPPEEPAAAA